MNHLPKLARIPSDVYPDYRYEVIFKGYKWDPQVEDSGTISEYALLMDGETADNLGKWAESLSEETIGIERRLLANLSLAGELDLPKPILKALQCSRNMDITNHIRVMRFDFHPTDTGWMISEVNSDVPGGFAEASVLPEIAVGYFNGYAPGPNTAEKIFGAFEKKLLKNGRIAFVHATSYADDRQVMQFLSDFFNKRGMDTFPAAPDHLRWKNKKAVCIANGFQGDLDGIARFFPVEWLQNLPGRTDWQGDFDTDTPSCNHPAAILTQSKRLPLIWDRIGADTRHWKALLPETVNPKVINPMDKGWVYKPALGRVGEGISIREAISEKALMGIDNAVNKYPNNWVAQRRFNSIPLFSDAKQPFHLCVGVFTVNCECAGFYGRISHLPRIDERAKDIPILIAKG